MFNNSWFKKEKPLPTMIGMGGGATGWVLGGGYSGPLLASGGTTQEYTDPGPGAKYKSHTFSYPNSDSFQIQNLDNANTFPQANKLDILVVGGGGAGGFTPARASGGGGAGGFVTYTKTLTDIATYTITVGQGGQAPDPTWYGNGNMPGKMSKVAGIDCTPTQSDLMAAGGAGGAGLGGGKEGGSGSGAGGNNSTGGEGNYWGDSANPQNTGNPLYPAPIDSTYPGEPFVPQGNDGGGGPDKGSECGSGGGGAGGVGGDGYRGPPVTFYGGAGGAGVNNDYQTGSNQSYCGGGGGCSYTSGNGGAAPGPGGAGGVGPPSSMGPNADGEDGIRGGGGGAAYSWPTEIGGAYNSTAGSGGDGVVVIRYRIE